MKGGTVMAKIEKEIQISTGDKPGTIALVTEALKDAGVNIIGACAWCMEGKGNFLFVTDSPQKTREALEKAGYSPTENEVVTVELANKVGALAEAGSKLGRAEINVKYCYLSASGDTAMGVFGTENNQKALEVLG